MTRRISAVAVCCSSASLKLARESASSRSRTASSASSSARDSASAASARRRASPSAASRASSSATVRRAIRPSAPADTPGAGAILPRGAGPSSAPAHAGASQSLTLLANSRVWSAITRSATDERIG